MRFLAETSWSSFLLVAASCLSSLSTFSSSCPEVASRPDLMKPRLEAEMKDASMVEGSSARESRPGVESSRAGGKKSEAQAHKQA